MITAITPVTMITEITEAIVIKRYRERYRPKNRKNPAFMRIRGQALPALPVSIEGVQREIEISTLPSWAVTVTVTHDNGGKDGGAIWRENGRQRLRRQQVRCTVQP